MVDTDDDKESIVTRLRGSQRTVAFILTALVILTCVSGVAVAFSEIDPFKWSYSDDFEDGELTDWSGGNIQETSYQETYSMVAIDGNEAILNEPFISISGGEGETVRMVYTSDGSGAAAGEIELEGVDDILIIDDNSAENEVSLEYQTPEDGLNDLDQASETLSSGWHNIEWTTNETYSRVWIWEPGQQKPTTPTLESAHGLDLSSSNLELNAQNANMYLDEVGVSEVPPSGVEGTVTDGEGDQLANVTVEASVNGSIENTATTNDLGQYELSLENGTYNVTASKDGYFPETETVEVSGDIVEQNLQLRNHSAALSIDTRLFLEHGESAPYAVIFEERNGSDARLAREDVTDNATVTSGDESIIVVNTATERIEATSDNSVNNRTFITAEYTTGGETYTTQQNVTVANETVDNLGILPPVNRFTASLSGGTDANPNDKTIMLLIIGAAAGAAASLIATSFAGVAALTMVMMLGWIMGMTGNGMAIVTVFIALFVGLNVAGNVDYTVRR